VNKVECVTKTSRYDIIIENGLFDDAPEYIKRVARGNKIAIVTDTNVAPLYGENLNKRFNNYGFESHLFCFKAGEASKNINTVSEIYDFLADIGLTRTDLIIALGGGVVGDMAGFAAATFLRGVDLIQIPTTLLSQVDSSVGGKTGFDHKKGKNLIGAFYQPKLVLIDTKLLETLSSDFYYDGMAEVIKYALIKDKSLFDRLLKSDDNLEEIIASCVKIKRDVVSEDEFDTGIRGILNFGHTFGHAAEKLENYQGISHGKAVAAGMVMATKIGEYLNITKLGTLEKVKAIIEKYNLPISFNHNINDIYKALINDKKNLSGKINLVLIEDIGKAFLYPIEIEKLKDLMISAYEN